MGGCCCSAPAAGSWAAAVAALQAAADALATQAKAADDKPTLDATIARMQERPMGAGSWPPSAVPLATGLTAQLGRCAAAGAALAKRMQRASDFDKRGMAERSTKQRRDAWPQCLDFYASLDPLATGSCLLSPAVRALSSGVAVPSRDPTLGGALTLLRETDRAVIDARQAAMDCLCCLVASIEAVWPGDAPRESALLADMQRLLHSECLLPIVRLGRTLSDLAPLLNHPRVGAQWLCSLAASADAHASPHGSTLLMLSYGLDPITARCEAGSDTAIAMAKAAVQAHAERPALLDEAERKLQQSARTQAELCNMHLRIEDSGQARDLQPSDVYLRDARHAVWCRRLSEAWRAHSRHVALAIRAALWRRVDPALQPIVGAFLGLTDTDTVTWMGEQEHIAPPDAASQASASSPRCDALADSSHIELALPAEAAPVET